VVTATAIENASILRVKPWLLDSVFDKLRKQVKAGIVPAAALAVGDEEGEIRSETFTSDRRPIHDSSFFFLASLTKPIFATAFMQLVEEGHLGLYDPICTYIPEFGAGPKAEISPWHLLTHTSGVADLEPEVIRRMRPSAAQMTSMVLEAPLRFPPGTRWEYCSASFYLLGLLIERVARMPYREFLQKRLVAPLGMNTTFDPRGAGRPIVPVHGAGVDNRLTRFFVLRYMAGAALPGGGLFGTVSDLMRFGAATLAPRVVQGRYLPLAPQTIDHMSLDHTRGLPGTVEGELRPVHFGLGWGKPTLMRDVPGSARVISHGGASGTRLWIDPEVGLVVAYLTNRWWADREPENDAVVGTYRSMKLT
jgi:CubicO group peptidase (beta-lactamase class C family)